MSLISESVSHHRIHHVPTRTRQVQKDLNYSDGKSNVKGNRAVFTSRQHHNKTFSARPVQCLFFPVVPLPLPVLAGWLFVGWWDTRANKHGYLKISWSSDWWLILLILPFHPKSIPTLFCTTASFTTGSAGHMNPFSLLPTLSTCTTTTTHHQFLSVSPPTVSYLLFPLNKPCELL